MTVAQQIPPTRVQPAPSGTPPRNGRWSGFNHLLMARLLELKREPEVIFWVFGFPVLLALGLGIAFRNKPADITPVAIVAGPGADDALSLIQHSPRSSSIRATVVAEPEALQGFRLGKYDLVIVPDGTNSFQYRYDPARPESVLSRAEVDDALQSAAGRKDPLPTTAVASSEPGSRYIDFLIPGLLGMNLMNSGMWGIGFALVDMRQRKLLKRFVGTPMRRSDFLLALTSSRLVLMVIEIVLLLGFGVLAFHMRVLGSVFTILLLDDCRGHIVWRPGAAHRQPGAENRKRQRADEPGDDADVDLLRRIFLLRALSRDVAALHQIAAADRAERCLAGHDSSGCLPGCPVGAPAGACAVGRNLLRAGSSLVPLDLINLLKSCESAALMAHRRGLAGCIIRGSDL